MGTPHADSAELDEELELEYQFSLSNEKVRLNRKACLCSAALFVGFAPLDVWGAPSALSSVWTVRAFLVMFSLGVFFLAERRRSFFLRHYAPITMVLGLAWGGGVLAFVALASPSDKASGFYHIGLILAVVGLYISTLLTRSQALIVSIALCTGYIAVAIEHQHMLADDNWITLVGNSLILISAIVIGWVGLAIRERFSREVFHYQHALRVELHDEVAARKESDERSRRYRKTAHSLREAASTLEALATMGQHMTACREVSAVYQTLHSYTTELLDCMVFDVYTFNPKTSTLSLALGLHSGRAHGAVPDISLDDPRSRFARCARERAEIGLEQDFSSQGKPKQTSFGALIYPLIAHGSLLGVVGIQCPPDKRFGDLDRIVFRALCAYGAMAIDNRPCPKLLAA